MKTYLLITMVMILNICAICQSCCNCKPEVPKLIEGEHVAIISCSNVKCYDSIKIPFFGIVHFAKAIDSSIYTHDDTIITTTYIKSTWDTSIHFLDGWFITNDQISKITNIDGFTYLWELRPVTHMDSITFKRAIWKSIKNK